MGVVIDMRLIDGDALIAEYDRVHIGEPGKARKLIEDAPTIEPERTGKWIYEPAYDWHRCGACKKVYSNVLMEHFNECQYQPRFNYCPNCGARMES